LPEPEPGLPSHYRPPGAKPGGAWVAWLEPADLSEAEAGIYPAGRPAANIMKAMSLVPDAVKSFFDVVSYPSQGPFQMRDFSSKCVTSRASTARSAMRKSSCWRRGCRP